MNHKLVYILSLMLLIVSFQNCAGQYGIDSSPSDLSDASVNFANAESGPLLPDQGFSHNDNNHSNNNGNGTQSPQDEMINIGDEPEISAEEVMQYCSDKSSSKSIQNLSSISNLSDLRGMMSFQIDSLAFVQNVKGKIKLHGLKEDSSISLVENVTGLLILCHVSVKEMKNGNGNVLLYDSQIDRIEGHQGSIKIVSGVVGEVVHHRGNIKYIGQ